MCLIIASPEGKVPEREILENAALTNRDGWGVSWLEGGKLFTRKSPKMKGWEKAVEGCEGKPFIAHVRLATHGLVNQENCHPFRVTANLHLAHNGILRCVPEYREDRSDTWHLVELLSRMIRTEEDKDWIYSPEGKAMLESWIGKSNKLALLDATRGIGIVNEAAGVWQDGMWYSNTGAFWSYDSYNGYAWDDDSDASAWRKWDKWQKDKNGGTRQEYTSSSLGGLKKCPSCRVWRSPQAFSQDEPEICHDCYRAYERAYEENRAPQDTEAGTAGCEIIQCLACGEPKFRTEMSLRDEDICYDCYQQYFVGPHKPALAPARTRISATKSEFYCGECQSWFDDSDRAEKETCICRWCKEKEKAAAAADRGPSDAELAEIEVELETAGVNNLTERKREDTNDTDDAWEKAALRTRGRWNRRARRDSYRTTLISHRGGGVADAESKPAPDGASPGVGAPVEGGDGGSAAAAVGGGDGLAG